MNKEILDLFGEKIVQQILDGYYEWIPKEIYEGIKNPTRNEINTLFSKLSDSEKKLVIKYCIFHLEVMLFEYLHFFELNPEFKLMYDDGEKKANLVEISEMLKAESLGENGWIERFSKYKSSLPL